MKKKDLLVHIPVYKEWSRLDKNEQSALTNTLAVLSSRDTLLTFPKGMNVEGYGNFTYKISIDPGFCTYKGYNSLLQRKEYYQIFESEYKYLAIVQPDVWIFEDRFNYWIRKFDKENYDYVGAPWYGVDFVEDGSVGNGGFCLRRLSTFVELTGRYKMSGNEDVVYCKVLASKLRLVPEKLALKFSFEENPLHCFYLNHQKLPMGTHGYAKTRDRLNFWKKYINPIYNQKGEQISLAGS